MAGANFKKNPNFERELNQAIQGGMKDLAKDYQRMVDALARKYKGQPISEIKPVLSREWSRIGGKITDPELTDYATHISDGTRIEFTVGN